MAKFRITAIKPITNEQKVFWYDNMSSMVFDEQGTIIDFGRPAQEYKDFPVKTSVDSPAGKNKDIQVLKIQLGLSCNYECTYCNQRFVPHADETTKDDVAPFLETLPTWLKGDGSDLRVEFWGGEPFVYWKTLKPHDLFVLTCNAFRYYGITFTIRAMTLSNELNSETRQ